jgi:hypothetical protein
LTQALELFPRWVFLGKTTTSAKENASRASICGYQDEKVLLETRNSKEVSLVAECDAAYLGSQDMLPTL